MTRTHSQLAYQDRVPERGDPRGTIVALHGDQGGSDDLLPLARAVGPQARIIAPMAARGVYHGVTLVSRTWFGGSLTRPEPASFGDSLAQVERFLVDVYDRRHSEPVSRPLVLGYDQGAVLALAAAKLFPDLISGVIAIAGTLPAFRDWGHERVPAHGLPVLIVFDEADTPTFVRQVQTTTDELTEIGAVVSLATTSAVRELGSNIQRIVSNWYAERVEA
jgi:predicted esterase